MADLIYLDALKLKLTEFGKVEDELSRLSVMKEELRDQVRKWLDINELTEYETLDGNDGRLWRLSVTQSSRNTVNVEALKAKVTEAEFNELVSKTEFEVFKCQLVKTRKKSSSAHKAPKAPRGNS